MSQVQINDVSGGIQTASTWLQRQSNEVYDAENMRFDRELGAAERRAGYTLYKTLGSGAPGAFFEAKFKGGIQIYYAYNSGSNTVLYSYNPSTNNTLTIKSDYPLNTKLQLVMNAGELYVAGITTDTGARQTIINVQENGTVSTTRNLFGAPKAAFIGENSGALYAMNVELNGTVYADRAYISSPQRGAITYVNAAMNNTYAQVNLINQVPPMTSATTPTGAVTVSTGPFSGEEGFRAFDRNNSSVWTANANTGTLQYDFGTGVTKIITYYAVTGGRSGVLTRAPKTWTLEGSNNGSSWTVLDTQTNAPAFSVAEQRTYPVSNTTAYEYYRMNITLNQGDATNVDVIELALYSSTQGVKEMQIKVDSARYVKVGMPIDIYKTGTNTKIYTVIPTSVDKTADTFNFLPYQVTATGVNSTTDTITVADATQFPTGQPIQFTSTGTIPSPLVAGTTYYAINTGTTTFKVAGSLGDSQIGAAIDLTATGSGTITAGYSYTLTKTDELWLAGRHDDPFPSILWNTDYRTPQTADFIFIATGKVADTSITGWAKSNNRMNIFTRTSMWQYDNANFLPVFEDIGCVNHDTIVNNATWIIWLDATGKVRARDSNAGTDQIISRGIKNNLLDKLTQTNFSQASAVMWDSNYKLSLGTINGKITRLVYNFDMNIWWRESHKRRQALALVSNLSGIRLPYFLDETGKMYLDENGNLDETDSIPWYLQWGRRSFGTGALKIIDGLYVYAKNIGAAVLMVKLPGNDNSWQTLGQLTEQISEINIPDSNQLEARDYDFKAAGNSKGDAPRIEGIEVWLHVQQANFN